MVAISEITDPFPFRADIAGQATAGTADEWVIMRVGFKGVIKGAFFTPKNAQAFDGTNFATLRVRNRGAAGAGNVQVAALPISSAPNALAAFTPKSLGTLANTTVAVGDVITLEKVNSGTGMIIPPGVFELLIQSS